MYDKSNESAVNSKQKAEFDAKKSLRRLRGDQSQKASKTRQPFLPKLDGSRERGYLISPIRSSESRNSTYSQKSNDEDTGKSSFFYDLIKSKDPLLINPLKVRNRISYLLSNRKFIDKGKRPWRTIFVRRFNLAVDTYLKVGQ